MDSKQKLIDGSVADLDESLKAWRKRYISFQTFVKMFRFLASYIFNYPGQLIHDHGLFMGKDSTIKQNWGTFIVSWLNFIPGVFIGSVLTLYQVNNLKLQNNSEVSWVIICGAIFGALITTSFVTICYYFSIFLANYFGMKRLKGEVISNAFSIGDPVDEIMKQYHLLMRAIILGYCIPTVLILIVAFRVAIHLPGNLQLLAPGVAGGVAFKVLGTLLSITFKAVFSSLIIKRILNFLRGHDENANEQENNPDAIG